MDFELKTKIKIGYNALKKIDNYNKVLLVCDPFLFKNGAVNNIQGILCPGAQLIVFDKVQPDPTTEIVACCVRLMEQYRPDIIIAFGGGSAIDTAKAVKYIYYKANNEDIRLVAIPTTSGTGSEVTDFAVISDKLTNTKNTLNDYLMQPDIAILDYQYTKTVPKNVTANTGMDVLTHAFEAYVSTSATDFTDALSEKAVELVYEYLPAVVNAGSNELYRSKMHNASCIAGVAFTNASLGICHSMAHALGAHFHLPHGLACGIILPYVIEYNSFKTDEINIQERYLRLANVFGISSGSNSIRINNFISKLQRFEKYLGICFDLSKLGIDKDEFLIAVPKMANEALKDRCTLTNPVKPSLEDIEEIYKKLL